MDLAQAQHFFFKLPYGKNWDIPYSGVSHFILKLLSQIFNRVKITILENIKIYKIKLSMKVITKYIITVSSTGLGFFVGRKMIEGNAGKVWIESEGKDKGSRFIVELPVGKDGN